MEMEEPTEEWRQQLNSWKSRRKSHSSNQRMDEFEGTEEELAAQKKAKTYSEMMEERSQRSITSTYPYYDDFDNSSNPRQSHDHPIDQNFESKEKLNNNELTYSNAGRGLDNVQQPEQTIHSNQQNMKFYEKVIRISQRPNHEKGFGFSISGGREFGAPFTVEKVVRGGSADICELKANDEIIAVNGVEVSQHYSESVQKVLDQSVATGTIELKVKRIKGDDADEEVFSDEDFEDDFDKPRQKSNLRYTESQSTHRSTPPPSPPHLSVTDMDDSLPSPPPLPSVPPPPPNWDTFPGQFSPMEQFYPSNLPETPKLPLDSDENGFSKTDETRDPFENTSAYSNNTDPENSKENLMRKRFEFLGLKPEHSEEMKALQEDKEKKNLPAKAEPVTTKVEPVTNQSNSSLRTFPNSSDPSSYNQRSPNASLYDQKSPNLGFNDQRSPSLGFHNQKSPNLGLYDQRSPVPSFYDQKSSVSSLNSGSQAAEFKEPSSTSNYDTDYRTKTEFDRSRKESNIDQDDGNGYRPSRSSVSNVPKSQNLGYKGDVGVNRDIEPGRIKNRPGFDYQQYIKQGKLLKESIDTEEKGPNSVAAWKRRDEENRKQEELERQMQEQKRKHLEEQRARQMQEQRERQIQQEIERESREQREKERRLQEQRERQLQLEQARLQEERDRERQLEELREKERQMQEHRERQIQEQRERDRQIQELRDKERQLHEQRARHLQEQKERQTQEQNERDRQMQEQRERDRQIQEQRDRERHLEMQLQAEREKQILKEKELRLKEEKIREETEKLQRERERMLRENEEKIRQERLRMERETEEKVRLEKERLQRENDEHRRMLQQQAYLSANQQSLTEPWAPRKDLGQPRSPYSELQRPFEVEGGNYGNPYAKTARSILTEAGLQYDQTTVKSMLLEKPDHNKSDGPIRQQVIIPPPSDPTQAWKAPPVAPSSAGVSTHSNISFLLYGEDTDNQERNLQSRAQPSTLDRYGRVEPSVDKRSLQLNPHDGSYSNPRSPNNNSQTFAIPGAINAVPKQRLADNPSWMQGGSLDHPSRQSATSRLIDPGSHWLVEEAERRRISEQTGQPRAPNVKLIGNGSSAIQHGRTGSVPLDQKYPVGAPAPYQHGRTGSISSDRKSYGAPSNTSVSSEPFASPLPAYPNEQPSFRNVPTNPSSRSKEYNSQQSFHSRSNSNPADESSYLYGSNRPGAANSYAPSNAVDTLFAYHDYGGVANPPAQPNQAVPSYSAGSLHHIDGTPLFQANVPQNQGMKPRLPSSTNDPYLFPQSYTNEGQGSSKLSSQW